MAQITGMLVTGIDFPRTFIREAFRLSGLTIADAEYVECKQPGELVIWLQGKTRQKVARDCLGGFQAEGHKKKLWAGDLPKDSKAPLPPQRPLDPKEKPTVNSVRGQLRRLIREHESQVIKYVPFCNTSCAVPQLLRKSGNADWSYHVAMMRKKSSRVSRMMSQSQAIKRRQSHNRANRGQLHSLMMISRVTNLLNRS